MKEQEQRPLGELHRKLNRVNRALVKVDTVSQTIGTSAFEGHSNLNERFDLSKLQGEPFLDAAVGVGMVKEALEERAKPMLLSQKEKVEREIENFDRVESARKRVEQIHGFVQRGLLPESVLENAQRVLANLTQSFTPPSTSAEEPHPVIVGRRGRNRIEARPSGVVAIVVGVAAEEPSILEEDGFVLPDDQRVFSLTKKEERIVSMLLDTSKEKPIASSEWGRSVYGDEVAINVAPNRISTGLPSIKRKLAEYGWKIVNLSPKGKEGLYYFEQVEKKGEKDRVKKAAEEERCFVLPDGQVIDNLNPMACVVVGKLLGASKEKPMSSSEIVRFLYGEELSIRVGQNRLSAMMTIIRRKLAEVGWGVVTDRRWVAGTRTGGEGWYHLTPLVKEIRKSRGKKADETVELPDGKELTNIGPKQKVLIEGLLCGSQEKPVTTSELAEMVYGEAVPKDVAVHRIYSNMGRVKEKLDSVGWEIVNLTPAKDRFEGKNALYYLAQKETKDVVEESPTEEKEKIVAERDLQEIEASLPDGQFIKVKGRKTAQVLEELTQTSKENQIATDDLAQVLFGSGDRSSISKTYQIVKRVQSQLESLNWRIVKVGGGHAERRRGEKMRYYLENVVEEKEKTIDASEKVMPTVQPTTPQEPKPVEIPIVVVGPVDAEGTRGVFVEIPYKPTEKEKRTEAETRILDVITSSLLATTRMRFEEVQRQLYSKDRAKPLAGGEAISIYQSQELVENFNSSFSKIREEAEIATLRENWDDKEKEMWKKLELLKTKFQVTEVRDFLRRVSEEIRRSERQFYIDYPPEKGNRVTWVRKDNNR